MKRTNFILLLLSSIFFFFSCGDDLKESFRKLWVDGTPPSKDQIEFYKILDYYVVNRNDDNTGFLTNNLPIPDRIVISINYFDESRVVKLIKLYETFKQEKNELIYASYTIENEMIFLTTKLDGNFSHSYRYNHSADSLIEILSWNNEKKCFCD